ncbi:hypothetical protein [Rhodopirellula europaea]|uniref:hypothetical protein n=1 Tax=Rhodopirellula europaea TaxID=1263866 RepID=UPI003D2B12AC
MSVGHVHRQAFQVNVGFLRRAVVTIEAMIFEKLSVTNGHLGAGTLFRSRGATKDREEHSD